MGGGASQFSLAAGDPLASLSQFDVGFFVLDDWRARPNLTVSLGLRYEVQTRLSDHRNFAPRLGLAWGVGPKGKAPKTVIRAGAGLFYDRVSESLSLDSLRRDGIHQQQFIVDNPDFYPAIPSAAQLLGGRAPQAIRELDADMRAPEMAQIGAGVERQLPKNIVLAVNYIHSQAWHSLRSRNITRAACLNTREHDGHLPLRSQRPFEAGPVDHYRECPSESETQLQWLIHLEQGEKRHRWRGHLRCRPLQPAA